MPLIKSVKETDLKDLKLVLKKGNSKRVINQPEVVKKAIPKNVMSEFALPITPSKAEKLKG